MSARSDIDAGPKNAGNPVARSVPLWIPILLVVLTCAAYANSFQGTFLFDDHRSIENNMRIRDLGAMDVVLSGRRPIMDLTLAINYAVGGLNTTGYHVVNLIVHLLAGLTLFGVVRRSLDLIQSGQGEATSTSRPLNIAFISALIWLLHPLQTESVTYMTQRSEALMGLFYLLTIYCVIRGSGAKTGLRWYVLAILCCALGMGSKAIMVTAPIVILFYDRAYLSSSWKQVVKQRWGLYVGLTATWSVLLITKVAPRVLFPAEHLTGTVGFAYKDVTSWEYLLTQTQVIRQYVWLLLWPWSQCIDYEWPIARSMTDALAPGFTVVPVLLLVSAIAWFRKPAAGFLGVWFFFILAPTSSIIPIKDAAFEHRMYLSLAAFVILGALLIHKCLGWLGNRFQRNTGVGRNLNITVAAVATLYFATGTALRNRDYQDAVTMWSDVVVKRPNNTRGHFNLGRTLFDQNRLPEAEAAFRQALVIDPEFTEAYYNLGKTQQQMGDRDAAAQQFEHALRIDPKMANARSDLGNYLARTGRIDEAIVHYRQAIQDDPSYVRTYVNLASVFLTRQEFDDAIPLLRKAVDLEPKLTRIRFLLGRALLANGDRTGAIAQFQTVLQIEPDHAGATQAIQSLRQP